MGNTADTPQDRSVHVGRDANRNVITTGDNNTVTVGMQEITLPAPDTVDMTRELEALGRTLAALDLEPRVQKRIANALEEAEDESNAETPDRDVVGAALEPFARPVQGV